MANFAIAADENVIARGNKLIEELQEPGEKKGVTLNRLFDLVSTHLQEDQLKRSGVDTEALDASITNIRNLDVYKRQTTPDTKSHTTPSHKM